MNFRPSDIITPLFTFVTGIAAIIFILIVILVMFIGDKIKRK